MEFHDTATGEKMLNVLLDKIGYFLLFAGAMGIWQKDYFLGLSEKILEKHLKNFVKFRYVIFAVGFALAIPMMVFWHAFAGVIAGFAALGLEKFLSHKKLQKAKEERVEDVGNDPKKEES